MSKKQQAVWILVGMAAALAAIWYFLLRRKYEVLDPSNSPELAAQFARMNPGLGA